MRMPGVGSLPGPFVPAYRPASSLPLPSPPSLPAAQTVTTPSFTSARCSFAVALSGLNCDPPVGPYELLVTRIGGEAEALTCGPHGAAWWLSTQFRPVFPP